VVKIGKGCESWRCMSSIGCEIAFVGRLHFGARREQEHLEELSVTYVYQTSTRRKKPTVPEFNSSVIEWFRAPCSVLLCSPSAQGRSQQKKHPRTCIDTCQCTQSIWARDCICRYVDTAPAAPHQLQVAPGKHSGRLQFASHQPAEFRAHPMGRLWYARWAPFSFARVLLAW
jgi:hypothetical protein